MSKIEIIDNEMLSFYSVYAAAISSEKHSDLLKVAFSKPTKTDFDLMKTIPKSFSNMSKDEKSKCFEKIKEIEEKIKVDNIEDKDGHITNIDSFSKEIQSIFNIDDKDDSTITNLNKCYKIFDRFYKESAEERKKAVKIMQNSTDQEILNQISVFFNTNADLKHNITILPKKTISGNAGKDIMHQFFL